MIYKNTPSRTFSIQAKLYSRTPAEAAANMQKVQMLRAWRYPFFGKGSSTSGDNLPDYTPDEFMGPPIELAGSYNFVGPPEPSGLVGSVKSSVSGLKDKFTSIRSSAAGMMSSVTGAFGSVKTALGAAGSEIRGVQDALQPKLDLSNIVKTTYPVSTGPSSMSGGIYGPPSSLANLYSNRPETTPDSGEQADSLNISGGGNICRKDQYEEEVSKSIELLGAPPEVLYLYAYSNNRSSRDKGWVNINKIPVVLTSLQITYPEDVDYIPSSLNQEPFPVRIDVSVSLTETHSPLEYENFSLKDFKLGKLNHF